MTELFRYRIDEAREMVLCDNCCWYGHDEGESPRLLAMATKAEMEMAAEIERLLAIIDSIADEAIELASTNPRLDFGFLVPRDAIARARNAGGVRPADR